MEPSLAAVKTFSASAAKADASAWSGIQQSSCQILGCPDGGSSRLASSAKAAVHSVRSANVWICCIQVLFTESGSAGKACGDKTGMFHKEDT